MEERMTITYTVTLNPALDISGTVEHLIPNEKNYVNNETHTPGGNGINAAIIANRLGHEVIATGFLGGQDGEEIRRLLDQEKLRHDFVLISGHTRRNVTVSETKTHFQTRLSFPGPKIKVSEYHQLIALLKKVKKGEQVLFGGSLPVGLDPQDLARLLRSLQKRGIICLLDVPGSILKQVIAGRPYFIKPNLTEFQELTGKKVTTIKSILPLVRKINQLVPLVCVSSVEGGAILVTKEEAWYGSIPKVKIRSSVGAGDSLVGGMLTLLGQDLATPVEGLLRQGLAAACATLTEEDLTLGSEKSIEYFKSRVKVRPC
jgi:1-phosphofructokinase family hexose kinase